MHLFQYLSQWKKENGSPPKQTTKNGAIKQAEGGTLLWHLKKEEKKQEVLPEMIKNEPQNSFSIKTPKAQYENNINPQSSKSWVTLSFSTSSSLSEPEISVFML